MGSGVLPCAYTLVPSDATFSASAIAAAPSAVNKDAADAFTASAAELPAPVASSSAAAASAGFLRAPDAMVVVFVASTRSALGTDASCSSISSAGGCSSSSSTLASAAWGFLTSTGTGSAKSATICSSAVFGQVLSSLLTGCPCLFTRKTELKFQVICSSGGSNRSFINT